MSDIYMLSNEMVIAVQNKERLYGYEKSGRVYRMIRSAKKWKRGNK